MDATTIVLLLFGSLLMFCGTIVLLVRAFQESVGWGVASLLIPFANVFFALCHWGRAKGSFICMILGTAMFIGGLAKTGASFSEEGLAQLLKEGVSAESGGSAEQLTASIEETRRRIEVLESRFATLGSELTKQYAALETRRARLKAGDAAAVERFNAEAAAYQAQNASHKVAAKDLEAARQQLQTFLDQRSKLQQTAKPKSASISGRGRGVVMYTTSSCPACVAAKSYFARKGISYDERDVNASPAAMQEFRQLGGRGVPLILVGSERMEGFDARRLDQLL